MSLHGRAVVLLRDVHTILVEDLADIDLVSLKAATSNLGSDPTAVDRWVRVLRAVSPSLVAMGREVRQADMFVSSQQRSVRFMKRILYILLLVVTALVTLAIAQLANGNSLLVMAPTLGGVMATTVMVFAIVKTWRIMIDQRLSKYIEQRDSPVAFALRKFKLTLSDRFIVKYAAAVTAGISLNRLVKEGEDDTALEIAVRNCGTVVVVPGKDCSMPIDPCKPPSDMPPLEEAVRLFCAMQLADIAQRLHEIRSEGVAQYQRPVLWRCVAHGVDRLRQLVLKENNVYVGPDMNRESVQAILREQVMPHLMIRAVEVDFFKEPSGAANSPTMGLPAGSTRVTAAKSRSDCWDACAGDPHCRLARYNPTTRACARCNTYDVFNSPTDGWQYEPGRPGPSRNVILMANPRMTPEQQRAAGGPAAPPPVPAHLMVCGPGSTEAIQRAQRLRTPGGLSAAQLGQICIASKECDAVANQAAYRKSQVDSFQTLLSPQNGSQGLPVCAKVSPAQLYDMAASGRALAEQMRERADIISANLFSVVQRMGYRLRLDNNRGFIDAELMAFYGHEIYTRDLVGVVDDVLGRVRKLVREARREAGGGTGQKPRYVDAPTLAARLAALNSGEWNDVLDDADKTQRCVRSHHDMFPFSREVTGQKVAGTFVLYGMFTMSIVYVVFLCTRYVLIKEGNLGIGTLCQQLLASTSLFAIMAVIVELIYKKYGIRMSHNHESIESNGAALTAALTGTNRELRTLQEVGTRVPPDPAAAQRHATTAVTVMRNAVEAFDRCNSVTSAQPAFPFPTVELVFYGIIALSFIAGAAFVLAELDAFGKADAIKNLMSMRARLLRGDASVTTASVLRIISCSMPSSFVWDIFIWFAIATLCLITAWFMLTTKDTADNYKGALNAISDCVE